MICCPELTHTITSYHPFKEPNQRLLDGILIPLAIIRAPEHYIVDMWTVALQEDVSSAERNENSRLIQRKQPLPFHRKDRVLVAPVRSLDLATSDWKCRGRFRRPRSHETLSELLRTGPRKASSLASFWGKTMKSFISC